MKSGDERKERAGEGEKKQQKKGREKESELENITTRNKYHSHARESSD